jgi:hypothetical protein
MLAVVRRRERREHRPQQTLGCAANSNAYSSDIDPSSIEFPAYTPPAPLNISGFPCYSHASLPTLIDAASPLSWAYYIQKGKNNGYSLWNAPAAINDICGNTVGPGNPCTGADYKNYVNSKLPCPGTGQYATDCAPILTDIENCALANVSWVIPDGSWSDHAGGPQAENGDGGPSWVANIVNAVGNQRQCPDGEVYWNNTVILVVWDDWGGYYDDVPPPDCSTSTGVCTGYSNRTGQQYVYGFRVPLLVIGAYTNNFPNGYISGANTNPPITCPNYYCHDFGSILNFIEYAFGLTQGGIGNSAYPYADALVMDTDANHPYSLSDFFTFSQSNFHKFQTIGPLEYPETCFHNPTQAYCFNNYPVDPDNDANESD